MTGLQTFQVDLQNRITTSDSRWDYVVPNLPKATTTNAASLIKSISFTSSLTQQSVHLRVRRADSSRITRNEPLGKLLLLSFEGFRLRQDEPSADGGVLFATARESAEYIAKVLETGVVLNGVQYHFFGHSNSQQKSRSCFMYAGSKTEIAAKVEGLGDFSKLKSVGKKVKRIGVLFSTADVAIDLNPDRCEDIPDIIHNDYTFTDGCGLISGQLARDLARRKNIVHCNLRYLPCVYQIRYRGYKGVLTLHPALRGKVQVQFRDSMKKFGDVKDHSFAIVEYSKPYNFGYLNDEVTLLLHALGISSEALLRKQTEYLQFLQHVSACEPQAAFRFLCYQGEMAMAERLLLEGSESVRSSCRRLVKAEYDKMLNKHEEQRCRIMIPQSRLLFGVCDPSGKLKPGTCFVRITHDGDGLARTLIGTEVLCTRNPTLHPGDLRKFKAVDCPELAHLVDCIVFPTSGERPSADLMSGEDLDGDKFFVTWDPDIIPRQLTPAAAYPGVKEKIQFGAITGDDRADFFAKSNNTSLGRVKNLYLKWARAKGPLSEECQQLNRLFSQCVDGNRIKVPQALENARETNTDMPPFILDILHASARVIIDAALNQDIENVDDTYGVMNLLSHRDEIAMSEFELIQLVLRACKKEGCSFSEYASHFNYARLSDEQRAWLLCRLPPTKSMPSLVMNGLLGSELLMPRELHNFRLDGANLHWKPVFQSSSERMGRFLNSAARAMESFHKKLIVIQPDERLTLMIYVPQKVERESDVQVDEALYESQRSNIFVFLNRGQLDKSTFQNAKNESEKRVKMQETFDTGVNAECRASIALNKISGPIQGHIGRLNRAPVAAAKIYVISNRDTESMRYLDAWLHYVDTEEVLPLFDREPQEYRVTTLQDLDKGTMSPLLTKIVVDQDLSALRSVENTEDLLKSLELLNDLGQKTQLVNVCTEVLAVSVDEICHVQAKDILLMLLEFLPVAPFLTETVLDSELWKRNKAVVVHVAATIFPILLRELILCANSLPTFVKVPFRCILKELKDLSVRQLSELFEVIAIAVNRPDMALDLLLECIEPECQRLISGSEVEVSQLLNNLAGIALEHIDEANAGHKFEAQMLSLRSDGLSDGFHAVTTTLRIDAPGIPLKIGDHV